jgi:hypothetical protein
MMSARMPRFQWKHFLRFKDVEFALKFCPKVDVHADRFLEEEI